MFSAEFDYKCFFFCYNNQGSHLEDFLHIVERRHGLSAEEGGGGHALEWKLLSRSHVKGLCQLSDLASDWLFTLVQPIRSHLTC